MMQLSRQDMETLVRSLTPAEMADMLAMMDELENRKHVEAAQDDFLAFIALIDKTYKFGTHLKRLGRLLMDVELGAKDRVAVSMAPRFGKSQSISIYYPAWYLGRNPDHKVIVASHTADLAVTMARKVRNLMQTAEYQAIFPGVRIAGDAKAAGKWSTNQGGEYFACLRLDVRVSTTRGRVLAKDIRVGDRLLNPSGGAAVQRVYPSQHAATYLVRGLACSAEHPIWTLNRGWVYASNLNSGDLLCSESILDRMKALFRSIQHGYLGYPDVPALVQHEVSVHQPKQRKVGLVRRARDYALRALAFVRELFSRHGRATDTATHRGSDRRERSIQPGELPVGHPYGAGEQPAEQRTPGRSDDGRARPGVEHHARDNSVPSSHRSRPSVPSETSSEELRAYDPPENLGWGRRAVAQLLSPCRRGGEPGQTRRGAESYMARAGRAAGQLLGVLVGVRRVGDVACEVHEPTPFVNFLTDGDHTFFADGVLTHNCGVGGALAGRGGHLIIVDDPISEQAIKAGDMGSLDTVYEWYRAGLRTRLMPGGKIVVLHTRWHMRDLIGRLVKDSSLAPDADQYEVFEFPAILNEGTPEQKSLWPEQWTLESLLRTKASMALWQWNAQYQQNPTAAESAIIKRDWIKWWPKEDPPPVDFIIQSWDTALTTKERSDWSVCQTWGVWENEADGSSNLILLNCTKGKWEFPDLKVEAHDQYAEWQPDSVIIEAKASGQPLIDEMRRSGIFVQDFSPGKGNDKIARLNAVADMFASGHVWFPETPWAQSVVEELLAFPAGENDDQVDTLTLALRRARTGGLLRLSSDYEDNDDFQIPRRKGAYTV